DCRNGGDERSGQHDAQHRVERGHADAGGSLDLASRHSGEAAAKDLGKIGRRVKAEAQDACGGRAESEPDRGAAGVDEKKLDQERRAAEELDERPEESVERRDFEPAEKRNREPKDEAKRAARGPAQDGDAETAQKRRRIMPELVQAHRPPAPASRRSATAPKPARQRLIAR